MKPTTTTFAAEAAKIITSVASEYIGKELTPELEASVFLTSLQRLIDASLVTLKPQFSFEVEEDAEGRKIIKEVAKCWVNGQAVYDPILKEQIRHCANTGYNLSVKLNPEGYVHYKHTPVRKKDSFVFENYGNTSTQPTGVDQYVHRPTKHYQKAIKKQGFFGRIKSRVKRVLSNLIPVERNTQKYIPERYRIVAEWLEMAGMGGFESFEKDFWEKRKREIPLAYLEFLFRRHCLNLRVKRTGWLRREFWQPTPKQPEAKPCIDIFNRK